MANEKPWRIDKEQGYIRAADNTPILMLPTDQLATHFAIATEIVTAVNSHAALVAALEEALQAIQDDEKYLPTKSAIGVRLIEEKIQAALDLAKGKK